MGLLGQGLCGDPAEEEKEMIPSRRRWMKKVNLVLAAAFLAVVGLTQAETQKGSVQKDAGTSPEEQSQEVMSRTAADARKDQKDALKDMKKTNEQKARQRKAIAKQKAAQKAAKQALKAKYDKAGGKATVTIKK